MVHLFYNQMMLFCLNQARCRETVALLLLRSSRYGATTATGLQMGACHVPSRGLDERAAGTGRRGGRLADRLGAARRPLTRLHGCAATPLTVVTKEWIIGELLLWWLS